ncbi:uncharacterized mitochondrial protein-like protein [Tanacetum coccineum]
MSVQSSSNQIELHFSNPEKSLQFRRVEESESDKLFHDSIQGKDKNAEDVPMADHLRPMEELLRIPILGIEDAIVVPAVLADQFELKPELLDFVRAAEKWLENEPPCSITTWDALLSKFLNRFFPYSKIREFRKEITNFQQVFGETFIEAWERFKDLLRKCPHHGFSLLHQIDFFYNGLCQSDQDSLNTAAGGNLMTRNIQDALTTIENKASVQTCRNTPQVSSSGGTSTQHYGVMPYTILLLNKSKLLSIILLAYEKLMTKIKKHRTDGLTLDGSFLSNSNFLKTEQEPETITEVVEIASSKSTPLVPPPKTPPLSAPKPKEDSKPNPYQPPIPYPCRLQEENFQIFPILSLDPVVESLSPSLTPSGEIDLLLEETDAFLSLDDSIPPGIDNGIYDLEGDILFLEELLNDEILRDLPPKELKDDEPSTTKSLIEKLLEIDNEIYDSEGDILFLENLLKDDHSKADKSEIYTLIGEPPDTFLMEDEEIKLNPLKNSDDSVPIPRPNGDALRKCILKGPYTPTIVTTPAVPATEDSPTVPEQTTVENVTNMILRNERLKKCGEAIERLQQGLGSTKRLNERKLQIQKCKVQEVKASDASSGDKDFSRIVSDKGNDQRLENQSNTSGNESSRSRNECNDKRTSGDDTDIRPSYDTKPIVETDQNAVECDDEHVALAHLIANLKCDIDENKTIQKQLKKANALLTQELTECKSILMETSRTLGESNSIRDSCLVALQNKQTEFERYKAFNDRTINYDKLERKLNETLGLLAQKEIDIKKGLKVKAYEISVVEEKHDELVK